MKRILIIPELNNLEQSMRLVREYGVGFEYNDFYYPDLLDDSEKIDAVIKGYKQTSLPDYCTLHGAFFDVTVFSPDNKIREISALRVQQSIDAAKKIGAGAVVFHTGDNPFLNSDEYVKNWLKVNTRYWSNILSSNPDVSFYLENMFENSPDIMARLSENLCEHANYGICLDYAHLSLTDVSPSVWAKALGRYVKHIHINDNNLKSDQHLPLGEGKIKWNEFYALYEKHMCSASVLIETSGVENQEKSIKKLIADGFIDK